MHVESSWIPKSCRLFHSRSRSAHETNSLSAVIAVDNTPANRPYSVPPNASKVVSEELESPRHQYFLMCVLGPGAGHFISGVSCTIWKTMYGSGAFVRYLEVVKNASERVLFHPILPLRPPNLPTQLSITRPSHCYKP